MSKILVYVLRRDLRLADNPIFADISKSFQQSHKPYTHVLPLYIIPAQQVECSGFLAEGESSPYSEARSQVGKFWRCGPNRARFLGESVWDLKTSLERVGNGLAIRAGMTGQVVEHLLKEYAKSGSEQEVFQVWMTGEEGAEEKREERDVRRAAERAGKGFKLWTDEKYYVHDDDVPLQDIRKLPDVFTQYRKMVEPLREAPRPSLPAPNKLPPFPASVPEHAPFVSPTSQDDFINRLIAPVQDAGLKSPPTWPDGAKSAHPFQGGERAGHDRVKHYITSGSATTYKDTRNGMLGNDFSTKFSAWLALGCISARQIQDYLIAFEDGTTDLGKGVHGYGKGENKGTGWIRFELLWRDYFRLCTRKFGTRLFMSGGFKGDDAYDWKGPGRNKATDRVIERMLEGTSGIGLVDASQRELYLTGYTSNRARQNVASVLAKHLDLDWRIGAEWYECNLIDYDVSSNWGNWTYAAGVGNDPREARMFNPVKQSNDYDPKGDYISTWVPELRQAGKPEWIFSAWKMPEDVKEKCGLKGSEMADSPLKKVEFRSGGKNGGRGGGGGGRGGNRRNNNYGGNRR